MTTVAEVRLWGRTIAAVSLDPTADVAAFEYTESFQRSGIEVAPLMMPLAPTIYRFPQLPRTTFHGLPGLLADALPDAFGNAVIDAWLATQGRLPDEINAVERLCYTGSRAMGALEFRPARGPHADEATPVDVDALVRLASDILRQRAAFETSFTADESQAIREILRVGSSAGGARAKAVIAWNPETNEVVSGQVDAPPGFEHWLLKFDGVANNRDRELDDPQGYGLIEYAYANMARDAGITMMECRLFEEHGRHHFMTRRFDRTETGGRLHMQSLGAMAHFDFNNAGGHSYEQAMLVIRRLGMTMDAIEEQFRRMAFNIIARNHDDHVKNIAFLMDQRGAWSLSPAFDLTYSYNPSGAWTSRHQMTLNGKRDGFTIDDFDTCGETIAMRRGRPREIIDEVTRAVRRWPDHARDAGVPNDRIEAIARTHRLTL